MMKASLPTTINEKKPCYWRLWKESSQNNTNMICIISMNCCHMGIRIHAYASLIVLFLQSDRAGNPPNGNTRHRDDAGLRVCPTKVLRNRASTKTKSPEGEPGSSALVETRSGTDRAIPILGLIDKKRKGIDA